MRQVFIFLCLISLSDCFAQSELNSAAKKGDFGKVLELLDKGCNIEERDAENYTPLLSAYFYSHDSLALYLIKRGANLNVENNYGWTILMVAVGKDSIPLIKFLLDKGAEINYISKAGKTALDKSDGKTKNYLISKGAKTGFSILNAERNKFTTNKKGKQGYWEIKEFDGTITGKGQYKNNLKIGYWKYYQSNGLIHFEGEYRSDRKNGVWKSYFYPDGTDKTILTNIEMYKDGVYDGAVQMEW